MAPNPKSSRVATPRKPATVQTKLVTVKKPPPKPSKPNASILNFFQKTEKPEEGLFVGGRTNPSNLPTDDIYGNDENSGRLEDDASPAKKRKTESGALGVLTALPFAKSTDNTSPVSTTKKKTNVPFVMDSDSEGEDDEASPGAAKDTSPSSKPPDETFPLKPEVENIPAVAQVSLDADDEYGDAEDFDLEMFEGEEMRERRFMQEQARLEAEEAGDTSWLEEQFGDELGDDGSMAAACPICNGSLDGTTPDEASRHVNSCLDGNPTPLPSETKSTASDAVSTEAVEVNGAEVGKRFAKAAVPRPGQANPFDLSGNDKNAKSAFSQLMSGNAEDSAWATAAAAENASRGRPAYMRTCPFYKIMPGFSICVDAFRYGAVEGCKAYFLSHFHSDHYIGLTANWTHGPIYCSKVTGSLVKKQLRTAEQWVVELDFEETYDIPGTDGAKVTMIPANHCPGSSMFIFEKPVGSGPNKKMKRILHCGDFRACPEHIRHPMLKPDISDATTGKLRQQKIDICYLDTTYLNPRYSFPPQGDVIQASAELCASLAADPDDHTVLQHSKDSAGTESVSKYFQSNKTDDKPAPNALSRLGRRLLVICGTYSIGKERICVAIAKALKSKIFATPAKIRICKQLDDPELSALLTSDPKEAQVHMQMLMEIRAETLQEYLNSYKPHFTHIVGFRPSGWNFRPTNAKSVGANAAPSTIATQQVLHSKAWRTRFRYQDFVAQRGSTKEAMCFGVPYSEHSSFRELALFLMCLRIDKVIPTVNVGSEQSRKRMKGWIDKWMSERRKGGLVDPLVEGEDDEASKAALWDGKSSTGGKAWW